jgi:hypothetical protein
MSVTYVSDVSKYAAAISESRLRLSEASSATGLYASALATLSRSSGGSG